METYYFQETSSLNAQCEFSEKLTVSSLSQAKRVASRKQFYYDTVLKLYGDPDCRFLIAYKLDGRWIDNQH